MKRKILLILCVCVLVVGTLSFVACANTTVEYQLELPKESDRVGYYFYFNGEFGYVDDIEGTYSVPEGNDIELFISAYEGYTLDDIVVKNNGTVMEYQDESDETTQQFKFKFSVTEDHNITIEGVRKIQSTVTLKLSRYELENGSSEYYADPKMNQLSFKWNDNEYSDFESLKAAVNNSHTKIEYGNKFVLWVTSTDPLLLSDNNATAFVAATESANFDGIFGTKTDEGYERKSLDISGNTAATFEKDVDSEWYKYEITIHENTTVYLDGEMLGY